MEQWIQTATATCEKWKPILQQASANETTAEDFLADHLNDWTSAVQQTFGSKGRKHLSALSNTTMRGRMLKAMVAIVDLTKSLDTKRDKIEDATLMFLQLEAELQRITTALRKLSGNAPGKVQVSKKSPQSTKEHHSGHKEGLQKQSANKLEKDRKELAQQVQHPSTEASDSLSGLEKDRKMNSSDVVTPRPAALETLDDVSTDRRPKRARTLPPPRRGRKARALPPPRKAKKGASVPVEAEAHTSEQEPIQSSQHRPSPPPLPIESAEPSTTAPASVIKTDEHEQDVPPAALPQIFDPAQTPEPAENDASAANASIPMDQHEPQAPVGEDASTSSDEDGPTDELQSLNDPQIHIIEEPDEDSLDVTKDHGLVDDAVSIVETGENEIPAQSASEVFSENSREVEIQSVDLLDDHLLDEPVLPLKVKKDPSDGKPAFVDAPQFVMPQPEQDQVPSRALTSGEDARITALELYVARLRSADSLTVEQRSAMDHIIAVLGMALPKNESELAKALAHLDRLYSQSEESQISDLEERRNVLDGLTDIMRTTLFRASDQAQASGIDFVLTPTKRWDAADHLPIVDLARILIDDLSPWRLPSSLLYLDGPAVSFRFSAQAKKGVPLAWPIPDNRLDLSVVAATDRILAIALHIVAPDADHPLGRMATAGLPGGGVHFQVNLPSEEIGSLHEGIRQFAISETGRFIRTLRRNIVR